MTALLDARGRPIRFAEAAAPPVLDEVAARGRDDIFLGFIRAIGLDERAILLNPDAVLQTQARGKGLALYDEVLADPKVFSVMQTRKLAVVGKEWRVLPASEAQRDVDVATDVRKALEAIPSFHLDLLQAMDAVAKGYAITEVMWQLAGNRIGIADLRQRDQRRFAFTVTNELRLLSAENSVEGTPVPDRKFLHFVFDPRNENPYGEALLQRVYWWWWFKKHGVKFWMIFAEKFGMPTAVGKYPPGATPEQKSTLLDAITAIQQEYGVAIPNTMAIDLMEAQRSGTVNTYQELLDYCDTQIALAVLGQTLTSQVGSVGSLAAAKVHEQVRQDYVEADAKTMAATVNQGIRWLCDFNEAPSPAGYPQWLLMVTPTADLEAQSTRDDTLVRLGLRIPTRYFYKTYEIPEPAPDDEVVTPIAPPPAAAPPLPAAGASSFAEVAPGAEAEAVRLSDHAEAIFTAARAAAFRVYAGLADTVRQALAGATSYDAAVRRLPDALGVDDQAPLATLLHRALVTANLAARGTVIEDAAAAGAAVATMAEMPFDIVEPLSPDAAYRWFTSLRPMTPTAFATLSDALGVTAFRVARVESDTLLGAIKDALARGLKDGTTFRDFLGQVNDVFARAGVTRLNPFHLDTVFRTNLKTAYEAGRFEQFQDPDVAPFFPFFQYHAVMDVRTRPNHAAMNGRIYATSNAIWSVWYPPCGFNCRCTVTAVSAAEARQRGLTESDPPPAWLQPDPGFGGTPVAALRRAP